MQVKFLHQMVYQVSKFVLFQIFVLMQCCLRPAVLIQQTGVSGILLGGLVPVNMAMSPHTLVMYYSWNLFFCVSVLLHYFECFVPDSDSQQLYFYSIK